ncbi:competence protein [Lactobacillus sp. PV034]|nr:competence protein [Lactobacillus sp. PV034]
MYAALLDKKLVLAISEAQLVHQGYKKLNGTFYHCPSCKKRVILIISQYKAPFFKHLSLITGEGEKQEHLESKKLLCSALVACGYPARMEVSLAFNQLRADILASKKIAFEIQCAPLSDEEYQHRHTLYEKLNIKDIWIVGKRHYLKKKLIRSQYKYLRKSPSWGWYLLEIEPTRQKIHLKYHIQLEANSNRAWFQRKDFKLDEDGLKQLFTFMPPTIPLKLTSLEKGKNYLYRQLRDRTKFGREVGELLYKQKLTLDQIPDQVLMVNRDPFTSKRIVDFLHKKRASH